MSFSTNTAIGLKIDTVGAVTKPLQPAFQAYVSATQSAATWGVVTVTWGGENWDIGSNFASNVFTAPVAGKYLFTMKLNTHDGINSSSSALRMNLVPSGQQFGYRANTTQRNVAAWSEVVLMAANDTCSIQMVGEGDSAWDIIGESSYKQSTWTGTLLV